MLGSLHGGIAHLHIVRCEPTANQSLSPPGGADSRQTGNTQEHACRERRPR